jgi:hypothetical protein
MTVNTFAWDTILSIANQQVLIESYIYNYLNLIYNTCPLMSYSLLRQIILGYT